jgi:hypothetical protein
MGCVSASIVQLFKALLTYSYTADEGIADLVLQHPRIFEYKVDETATYLTKGRARIQVRQ